MDYQLESRKLLAALEHSRAEAATLIIQNCNLKAKLQTNSPQSDRPPDGVVEVAAARPSREVTLREELSTTQHRVEQMRQDLVLAEMGARNGEEASNSQQIVSTLEMKVQQMIEQLRCAHKEIGMDRPDSVALSASRA